MIVTSIVVAIAAGVVAIVVRALLLGYPPPSVPHARALSRPEQALLAACADALFPPGGPIPVSGTEAGLVAYMDAYVARTPAAPRLLVRLLFLFTELAPLVFGPRRARFTRLAPRERVEALTAMSQSSNYFRRVAFLSMRTMLSMGYLANADVARSIGIVARLAPFEHAGAEAASDPRVSS